MDLQGVDRGRWKGFIQMAKGKWAQGIEPRHFQWVIGEQLAICERPGGYGTNHRRVRRQEEIIWIRENGFAFVISLIPSDHNLHSYDELGLPWKHWPFSPSLDPEISMSQIYPELRNLIEGGQKIVVHADEVSDRLAGFIGGYIAWSGMVGEASKAIMVVERLLGRQMGPTGRSLVMTGASIAGVVAEPVKLSEVPAVESETEES